MAKTERADIRPAVQIFIKSQWPHKSKSHSWEALVENQLTWEVCLITLVGKYNQKSWIGREQSSHKVTIINQ